MRLNNRKLSAALLCLGVLLLALPTAIRAETTGQYVDDATLTTKVKAAIVGDSKLKGADVSVETNQAAVNLTGTVQNKAQEDEAVRIAGQITGVKTVLDHLTVYTPQE